MIEITLSGTESAVHAQVHISFGSGRDIGRWPLRQPNIRVHTAALCVQWMWLDYYIDRNVVAFNWYLVYNIQEER